jgi:uncharacterized membrane protein YozB (DUF420 family)
MNNLRRHAHAGSLWALIWISGVITGVLIGLVLAAGVLL